MKRAEMRILLTQIFVFYSLSISTRSQVCLSQRSNYRAALIDRWLIGKVSDVQPITGALIDMQAEWRLYANDPTSRRQLIRNLASGNFKTLVAASAARRKPKLKPNRSRNRSRIPGRVASDRAERQPSSWNEDTAPVLPLLLLAPLPYRRLGTSNRESGIGAPGSNSNSNSDSD